MTLVNQAFNYRICKLVCPGFLVRSTVITEARSELNPQYDKVTIGLSARDEEGGGTNCRALEYSWTLVCFLVSRYELRWQDQNNCQKPRPEVLQPS